jgi:hypothetical protein
VLRRRAGLLHGPVRADPDEDPPVRRVVPGHARPLPPDPVPPPAVLGRRGAVPLDVQARAVDEPEEAERAGLPRPPGARPRPGPRAGPEVRHRLDAGPGQPPGRARRLLRPGPPGPVALLLLRQADPALGRPAAGDRRRRTGETRRRRPRVRLRRAGGQGPTAIHAVGADGTAHDPPRRGGRVRRRVPAPVSPSDHSRRNTPGLRPGGGAGVRPRRPPGRVQLRERAGVARRRHRRATRLRRRSPGGREAPAGAVGPLPEVDRRRAGPAVDPPRPVSRLGCCAHRLRHRTRHARRPRLGPARRGQRRPVAGGPADVRHPHETAPRPARQGDRQGHAGGVEGAAGRPPRLAQTAQPVRAFAGASGGATSRPSGRRRGSTAPTPTSWPTRTACSRPPG